ncbi:MAG: hypothetical protein GQ535_02850, partial [Rhodobacteraceae bacterium]|nr:hypothetical protein [Paracoccaceae bacterium]
MIRKFRKSALVILACWLPVAAAPQEAGFGLASPAALHENGFLRFLLPRFSLKTGIRIALEPDNPEAIISAANGVPLMQG